MRSESSLRTHQSKGSLVLKSDGYPIKSNRRIRHEFQPSHSDEFLVKSYRIVHPSTSWIFIRTSTLPSYVQLAIIIRFKDKLSRTAHATMF
jgi:hypothetical protein